MRARNRSSSAWRSSLGALAHRADRAASRPSARSQVANSSRAVARELLDRVDLLGAHVERLGDDALQVVEVEHVHAGQLAARRVDVARHGQVDEHERATVAHAHRRLDALARRSPRAGRWWS